MWRSIVAIALLFSCTLAAIQLPIVVKDTSGFGSTNFPTSVVIPLPYGEFQTTSSFRLTDDSQTTIPAQFIVQTRWAAKDNSIREVRVHFAATVGPYTDAGTGTTTYYFRDDGTGDTAPASNAIAVTDNGGSWTISNGLISIDVLKTSFTTISSLTLNGSPLLTSTGATLIDRFNKTQQDSALPVYSAEIEESGPLRSVVKVTALSKLSCQNYKDEPGCKFPIQHCQDGEEVQVQHGYAVRIYAYAGVSFVKVDYQLQNSPYSELINGYALYFDEMRVDYSVALNPANTMITIGNGDGTAWTHAVTASGYQLYQDFPTATDNVYRIRDGSGTVSKTGTESDGFLDVSDSSSGVLTFIRNFWQSWPNGISAKSSSGKVQVQVELFPKGGSMVIYGGTSDPSGLYWLDDMQHVYKEFYIYPHGVMTSAEMIKIANNFQWFPVVALPVSWYRSTSVTLDLGGHFPSQEDPIDGDYTRTILSEQLDSSHGVYSDITQRNYEFHWRHFGSLDAGYRDTSCTTGSYPYSQSLFLVSGNPKDYFRALDKGMGEINTRPQWMAGNYKFNLSEPYNYPGAYCGPSWRYWCNVGDQTVVPWLDESQRALINPRDDEHGWFYHALESYSITGNLWLKDWYTFVGEFRKSRLFEDSVDYPDLSSRATGHALNHAVQAFRVTGDLSIIDGVAHNIRAFRIPYQHPQFGDNFKYIEDNGGGYQTGYYMRAIVDYLEEISDAQAWAEGFHVIAGLVNFNQKFSHFSYYYQPEDQPEGAYGYSSSGSETCADPVAWYYYHTGIEAYREIIIQFQETGVPGFDGTSTTDGSTPYYALDQTWNGDWLGRLAKDVFNATIMPHDTRPPQISDLAAYLGSDGTMQLLFTAPSNAVRYHVVWATVPISENHTTADPNVTRNWWASNPVGPSLVASPGNQQTVAFTVSGASSYYVAMFSWDSIGNMSPMSNLAKSTNDPFPGVSTTGGTTGNTGSVPGSTGASSGQVSYAGKIVPMLALIVIAIAFVL